MIEVHKTQDSRTGEFTFERYLKDGVLHRDPDEGPALVRRTPRGTGILIAYYWKGELHRPDNQPAITEFREGDIMPRKKGWFWHGYLHSTAGRAVWSVDKETHVGLTEGWFVHGYNYRDPQKGPRLIQRDWETGAEIICEFTPTKKFIGPSPNVNELSKLFKQRADRLIYDLMP